MVKIPFPNISPPKTQRVYVSIILFDYSNVHLCAKLGDLKPTIDEADDRARDFSRRCGHLSGGADALAAVAETVAAPGGRRLRHPSRWVAGRPGQE